MGQKTFPCGHSGKGQFCHRCAQAEKERAQAAQQRAEQRVEAALKKQDWQAQLAQSPVPLGHVPKVVAERALQVMQALATGQSYLDFQGKRLIAMNRREMVSVPLPQYYRLVCREQDGHLQFVEVIPHEEYNTRLFHGGWGKA